IRSNHDFPTIALTTFRNHPAPQWQFRQRLGHFNEPISGPLRSLWIVTADKANYSRQVIYRWPRDDDAETHFGIICRTSSVLMTSPRSAASTPSSMAAQKAN